MNLRNERLPNTACSERWGALRQAFRGCLALSFFLLPSKVHARPHAGNANRWAARG